jgi:hypothetical protein
VLLGQVQPVDAVVRQVDGEPLGLQPALQRQRETHLVLDH